MGEAGHRPEESLSERGPAEGEYGFRFAVAQRQAG